MLKKIVPLCLSLSVLGAALQAQAAVITLSSLTTTGNNVGATSTGDWVSVMSQHSYYTDTVSAVVTHSSVVQTVPTPTQTGYALDYDTTTTHYTAHDTTWKYDLLNVQATTEDSQTNGGKSILFQGSISSSISTTLYLMPYADGSYVPSSSPFGAATIALPTLYLGDSLATLAPISYANSSTTSNNGGALPYYDINGRFSGLGWNITAGQTLYFAAAAYAPAGVSIGDFTLQIQSGNYNYLDATEEYNNVNTQLVGGHVLTVPEPETYAMLLVGLCAITLRRRTQRNPRFL